MTESKAHLRAVPNAAPLAYVNRFGDTYYLHAGETKTGKPRYWVAKEIGANAITAMPEGFEFTESMNGVVSVRRVREKLIPDPDVDVVRAELERHEHLAAYRVEVRGREIIVHAPDRGGLSDERMRSSPFFGLSPDLDRRRREEFEAQGRYSPVMKFELSKDGGWSAYRMTYRGEGGWSWALDSGPLRKLVKKLVRHLGTDEFYELI